MKLALTFETLRIEIEVLDERPKLASRCNILGKIVGDPRRLAAVSAGESVTVEKA